MIFTWSLRSLAAENTKKRKITAKTRRSPTVLTHKSQSRSSLAWWRMYSRWLGQDLATVIVSPPEDLSPKTVPPAHSKMLMAQELLFLVDFVIDEQLLKNLNLQIQSTPIKRHISTSIGLTLTVMFAWIPILIIFVSILRLSYVGPHRLAWWKVRIGDGLRIPDTRRIPRDTFPPSHTIMHLIQRLMFMQG